MLLCYLWGKTTLKLISTNQSWGLITVYWYDLSNFLVMCSLRLRLFQVLHTELFFYKLPGNYINNIAVSVTSEEVFFLLVTLYFFFCWVYNYIPIELYELVRLTTPYNVVRTLYLYVLSRCPHCLVLSAGNISSLR